MNWKRIDNFEEENVDGSLLLFNPESFKFFELNETMSFIWNLLETPMDEDAIANALISEFDAEESQIKQDVSEALKELADVKLIQKES